MKKDFLQQLEKERERLILPRGNTLTGEQTQTVIEQFREKTRLESTDQAIAIIAILFQQGGTARGCDGNMTAQLFGKTAKLAELRKTLKDCGLNKSERKLARSLANEIKEVCLQLRIEGNLTQKIKRANPLVTFTIQESVWLSDFQLGNPKAPEAMIRYVVESFEKKA